MSFLFTHSSILSSNQLWMYYVKKGEIHAQFAGTRKKPSHTCLSVNYRPTTHWRGTCRKHSLSLTLNHTFLNWSCIVSKRSEQTKTSNIALDNTHFEQVVYCIMYHNQQVIGWKKILQVKISKDWTELVTTDRSLRGESTNDRIMVKFIQSITTFTINLWSMVFPIQMDPCWYQSRHSTEEVDQPPITGHGT